VGYGCLWLVCRAQIGNQAPAATLHTNIWDVPQLVIVAIGSAQVSAGWGVGQELARSLPGTSLMGEESGGPGPGSGDLTTALVHFDLCVLEQLLVEELRYYTFPSTVRSCSAMVPDSMVQLNMVHK
jgi:hypothetical protein